MASATKQQNYRRLMKEAKVKSSSQPKKVDHPLARYNALDQLSCIVCQQAIKSELLWGTHLKSKRHKETMAELKSKKEALLQQTASVGASSGDREREESERAAPSSPPPPPSAPGPQLNSALKKKTKGETVGGDSEDGAGGGPPPAKKHKVTFNDVVEVKIPAAENEKSSLPEDFFDPGVTERVDEDADRNSGGRSGETVKSETNSQASADGKDSKTEEDNGANSSSEKSQESGGAIPEGFFDDPKMDAKVRKVEYKDKMEEEWERFQKTIQKENDVSEAIMFVDDEETQGERDFSEIQEQVECFQRAEVLRQKQERLIERRGSTSEELTEGEEREGVGPSGVVIGEVEEEEEEGESSMEGGSDDDLMDELEMDWRAKHS